MKISKKSQSRETTLTVTSIVYAGMWNMVIEMQGIIIKIIFTARVFLKMKGNYQGIFINNYTSPTILFQDKFGQEIKKLNLHEVSTSSPRKREVDVFIALVTYI